MRSVVLVALFASGAALPAADWPQFRGPGGSAVAVGRTPPADWDQAKNVKWATELPGLGWGSPVVAGGRVFVVAATSDKQKRPAHSFDTSFKDGPKMPFPMPPKDGDGPPPKKDGKDGAPPVPKKGGPPMMGNMKPPDAVYQWHVLCLDAATGKVLWDTTVAEKKPPVPTFPSNGYASETPATDGDRVYAYFGSAGGLYCLDRDGAVVWKKDLGAHPSAMGFGSGSSPVLADGRLFVLNDNEERSYLAAFDPADGKELWRAARKGTSWSTPFVWRTAARTEVVCCGAGAVTSYDPATGKELWRLGGVDSGFSATPAADADRVYFGTAGPGSSGPLYAVKAGATGDITLKKGETANEWVAWSRTKAGPGTASPLLLDGYLYVPGGRGAVSCYEAATGKPAYENERLPNARGFTASPWAAGGKVFLLDDAGRTHVIAAGPKFEVLGTNPLGEMCWASPAVVDGTLFIRGRDKLYCVADGK